MVHEYAINGRTVKTGDIISTRDGNNSIFSLGFHVIGAIIPGVVDHTVVYVGPGGLCVESGMRGVIVFKAGPVWGGIDDMKTRGLLDEFHAASSVFPRQGVSPVREAEIREFVRGYVLGCVGKRYNFNFLNPDSEQDIYCSQLAYLAYKKAGIDLNVGKSGVPGVDRVVFPQEILDNTSIIQENG